MTKPIRIRRFAGGAVWALAQSAYLEGEPAASIARRLDLTVNGIRKRAARHGWTRTAHARAVEDNADPARAMAQAVREAASLLSDRRPDEALSLLKAVQGLAKTLETTPQLRPPAEREDTDEFDTRAYLSFSTARTLTAVTAMRSANGMGMGSSFSLAGYHWRALKLGPEVAAADRALMGGQFCWDSNGDLLPLSAEYSAQFISDIEAAIKAFEV